MRLYARAHTPVSYKKENQKSKQRVIEFNLSKSVVIITTIVVILVALTTAKVVKTFVQAEDNKKLADTDGYSYMHQDGIGETRYEMLAQELEQNYYEMILSIKKYGGFYIGRYETERLNETSVVRKMDNNISEQSWYTMYKKCLTLQGNNDNVKISMISGNLFDETLEWLVKSRAKILDGTTLTYELVNKSSRAWGNYYDSTFKYIETDSEKTIATNTKSINKNIKIPTGSAEYTYNGHGEPASNRRGYEPSYGNAVIRLSCNALDKINYNINQFTVKL